jgi:hypothetical protein
MTNLKSPSRYPTSYRFLSQRFDKQNPETANIFKPGASLSPMDARAQPEICLVNSTPVQLNYGFSGALK